MDTDDLNTTLSVIIYKGDATVRYGLEEDQRGYQVAIEMSVLAVVWLLSVFGNVLVCIVIYRSRRVQSTTNFFVVSLAVSDLLLSFLCVPMVASRIAASRWLLGSGMCRVARFFQIFAPSTAMFILLCVCIDRFYTIIYPLSFKITRGTAKHMIACCWLLAFLCCSFCLYFFDIKPALDGSGKELCPTYIRNDTWPGIVYACAIILCTFLLPAMFVIIVYARVFRYIWRAGIGRRRFQRTMNPVPRAKVKMVKMLIIVSITTISLTGPYYIVHIWFTLSKSVYVHPVIFIASFEFLFLTALLKPIIYLLCNANFRRGCKEVFCMSTMKCYRSNTYAITTASHIGKKNHVGVMPVDSLVDSIHPTSVAFNRTIIAEKTAWPMSVTISSTCLWFHTRRDKWKRSIYLHAHVNLFF